MIVSNVRRASALRADGNAEVFDNPLEEGVVGQGREKLVVGLLDF